MKHADNLHTLVFNSLEQQIAVIDAKGVIVDVNRAWINFGIENGMPSSHRWVGRRYLTALKVSVGRGDSLADETYKGIKDVINGARPSFSVEYPCHSPAEQRWFMMTVVHLAKDARGLYVISHQNITQRKLAEERVQHMATHDPLTGLANRRHFDNVLKMEINRSARAQTPISLVALDVDHFKDCNDEHGHPKGDVCLVKIAALLRSAGRRPTDLAARLGGDEFALLLVDSDKAGSQSIAEDIVKAVSKLGITFDESRQITASVGVVSVLPNPKLQGTEMLNEADRALYLAKKAGRNCVKRVELGEEQTSTSAAQS